MERGTTNIVNPRRGSTDIQKVYRGTNLVWTRSTGPIPYELNSFETSLTAEFFLKDVKYQTMISLQFKNTN